MQKIDKALDCSKKQNSIAIEDYHISKEPFYLPLGDEVLVFETALRLKLPVMLKGPTGCGKTRFLEYMAWRCGRPLVTIACHKDLTASDLVGRYLLQGEDTVWMDGPLSLAVKHGAICYLDEVMEACKDTTVVIHSLTDDHRILPQEKRGLVLEAHPNFLLVISYNPGCQIVMKNLKQSTRQRFIALEFDYPSANKECEIIMKEGGVDKDTAKSLVRLGGMVRNLGQHGLEEGVSTRLLVYAAQLIHNGLPLRIASKAAVNCERRYFMEINPNFISPCGLYCTVCADFYTTSKVKGHREYTGRNPKTGKFIQIKPKKLPVYRYAWS